MATVTLEDRATTFSVELRHGTGIPEVSRAIHELSPVLIRYNGRSGEARQFCLVVTTNEDPLEFARRLGTDSRVASVYSDKTGLALAREPNLSYDVFAKQASR